MSDETDFLSLLLSMAAIHSKKIDDVALTFYVDNCAPRGWNYSLAALKSILTSRNRFPFPNEIIGKANELYKLDVENDRWNQECVERENERVRLLNRSPEEIEQDKAKVQSMLHRLRQSRLGNLNEQEATSR